MTRVADVVTWLEAIAPLSMAAEWDNVGLLLGDATSSVKRILTCLTVTPEVVAEAVADDVQLIVTHHPILFRGCKALSTNTAEGRLLWPLAAKGIAVYSSHTAFDNAPEGINATIAQQLGLSSVKPLRPKMMSPSFKVVVFVPEGYVENVADAMFQTGAGVIGQYGECSFRLAGTGTFFGNEHTKPVVGEKGRREYVSETRIEVVCPQAKLTSVLDAMRQAHPYEEPAFDVYPLHAVASSAGEGRWGRLTQLVSLQHFASRVKDLLQANGIQVVGDSTRTVHTVAIACGAAGDFLKDARTVKADVFITGEMRFHDYLAAQAQQIALLLPGHYASERPAMEQLARRLNQAFSDVHVWASRRESDPVQWL